MNFEPCVVQSGSDQERHRAIEGSGTTFTLAGWTTEDQAPRKPSLIRSLHHGVVPPVDHIVGRDEEVQTRSDESLGTVSTKS